MSEPGKPCRFALSTTMAVFWEHMQPEHIEWILSQKLFWVGSAPLTPDGHVNISPKGVAGTFHVINERKVWYEDLTGSGAYNLQHPIPKLTERDRRGRDNLSLT